MIPPPMHGNYIRKLYFPCTEHIIPIRRSPSHRWDPKGPWRGAKRHWISTLVTGKQETYVGDLLFIRKLTKIESEKFIKRALTLENNCVPLDTTFSLALSSHCLSNQIAQGPHISDFSTNFALFCTRWDTSLVFKGIGFEYVTESSEKMKSVVN